jgi:hypothetical protein
MITINYFSHKRLNFSDLTFYFLNKIKSENKSKIKINILSNFSSYDYFQEEIKKYDLPISIIKFSDDFNYTEKLKFSINQESEFSVKLDEDCFINNHIWDFIIENCNVLDNEENLLVSPILSTTIPSCDLFVNNFLEPEEANTIKGFFLSQEMPMGLFEVDYTPLNQSTIMSKDWDYKRYYKILESLPTDIKGMHPMRISYNSQTKINEYILNSYSKILNKNEYDFIEIETPYFTNNFFLIKTKVWKKIIDEYGQTYDEIPISNYHRKNNTKIMFVNNGFGIHTMYNTIYGNKNRWGIGGEDSEEKELKFVNELKKIIL